MKRQKNKTLKKQDIISFIWQIVGIGTLFAMVYGLARYVRRLQLKINMKRVIIMSFLTTLFGLFSCNAQSDKFKTVDVEEFAKVIADTSVVRLDVRTPEEYAEGHIDGALNIDVLNSDFEQKANAVLPKDKAIALYCRSGKRSKRAAEILSTKGYTIVELNTGYNGWTGAGKKIVK